MTDRYNAFIVILAEDLREDDARATIEAIKQIKHVQDVQPHVRSFEDAIAESRVKAELAKKLFKVLQENDTI
jgi:hypothetical protein